VSFYCQIPSLPSATNYVEIDPDVKDAYGIPVVRVHFQWGPNELLMWEHAKDTTAAVIKAAGGEIWGAGKEPYTPGWSLHETGTLRMGNDPKRFVTNRFGQTHDVKNLLVIRMRSLFLGCSDRDDAAVHPGPALRGASSWWSRCAPGV
jgi:choline dehydrogenase-like flavoprotein